MIPTYKILENKGFKVKDENKENLETRWEILESQKKEIELSYLQENKIGLTNVPGGDDID